jgi:hypothetical protein
MQKKLPTYQRQKVKKIPVKKCAISDSRRDVDEIFVLLRFYAA